LGWAQNLGRAVGAALHALYAQGPAHALEFQRGQALLPSFQAW